jgi:uncharacterized protein YjiS (DUF1127 family)
MRSFGQVHDDASSPALGVQADDTASPAMFFETAAGTSFAMPPENLVTLVSTHSVSEERARSDASPRSIAARMSWLLAAMRRSARTASPVVRLVSWMRREWELKRAIMDLKALDDYKLRDMGVPRCQIENLVRGYDHPER